jgi:regulatory protein
MALPPARRPVDGPTPGSSADDLPDADPYDVARAICLQQLTSSPKTRGQLATVLRRRGVDPDVASTVLDRLTEVALVDDAAFSEHYVRTRRASSGKTGRALGQELRAKGVAADVVSEALAAIDPDDELAGARALVAKKLPSTRGVDVEARTRRMVGMLARKGYPGGLAMRVVREALATERELDVLERSFLDGLDVELSDAARLGE